MLAAGSLFADENVRAAQQRLKEAGFYFGEPNGTYDSEAAAAVTRYQIRNGLQISGQLDAETTKALGITAPKAKPSPPPGVDPETWRKLRKSDRQFLKKLDRGEIPPPPTPTPAAAAQMPAPAVTSTEPVVAQPPAPTTAAPATDTVRVIEGATPPAPPIEQAAESDATFSNNRIRDYVGAFVLAGIDPKIGSELEFFADRVSYFDQGTISRDKIRADLANYAKRWPQRRFWVGGEIDVSREANGRAKVTFPLRYELRSGSRSSSGQVIKTLTLEEKGDDLQIVAVSERKSN